MTLSLPILISIASTLFLAGLMIGYLIAKLRDQKRTRESILENTRLEMLLENEKTHRELIVATQKQQQYQLKESIQNLSSQVFKNNSESFLQLAKESLAQFHTQAKGELEKKEQSFDALIKPIRDTLDKTQNQIQLMENERKQSYGSLNKHLESMSMTQKELHAETRHLVQAFRRPEVRGQWGELTLKRLVELAGMVEHCDFIEQLTVETDEGNRLRPDMIIRMPAGREIIIDCKTPLDAYLDAVEANSDAEKQQALDRHLKHVRQRIRELASKTYWQQFNHSPDFVVLFIPGDQFLTAAMDLDRQLLENALQNKIILATPSSFVALLRAVAYGWRQENLTENAELIRQLGEELYSRLATFTESLSKTGKSLEQSVNYYNKSVASFSARILPSAKKFKELGISSKKELSEISPVEKSTRQLESELNPENS